MRHVTAPVFRSPPPDMVSAYHRDLGPGVGELVDDDTLIRVADDDGVALLRASSLDRDLLLMHQEPGDTDALLGEADALSWLVGRGPAPELIASGRNDHGGESLAVAVGTDAATAGSGHPMGPEAFADVVASALRSLHALAVEQCPLDAGATRLRSIVSARLERGEIREVDEGPYRGRRPADLVHLLDDVIAELGPVADPVFVHAGLRADRLWLDPDGTVTFTGWRRSGVGDRHLDLVAAAAMATELYGPALVAPLFDSYGFDDVDARRLDACQLLVHLLP